MDLWRTLPAAWREFLAGSGAEKPLDRVADFLIREMFHEEVFPAREEWFAAFQALAPADVRAVILGQDPYHEEGQAHGLAFSVKAGTAVPPSLRNIFKELSDDVGVSAPASGDLSAWAANGVLLLNSVLTVRAGTAGSHSGRGWEEFTDRVIAGLSRDRRPKVFILWGTWAGKKAELIDGGRHLVLRSAHPSPLSASRGFFGSRPFSRANEFLTARGEPPIPWGCLPRKTEQLELGIL